MRANVKQTDTFDAHSKHKKQHYLETTLKRENNKTYNAS